MLLNSLRSLSKSNKIMPIQNCTTELLKALTSILIPTSLHVSQRFTLLCFLSLAKRYSYHKNIDTYRGKNIKGMDQLSIIVKLERTHTLLHHKQDLTWIPGNNTKQTIALKSVIIFLQFIQNDKI